jgi:formylglycine-generating enzyme required for sulfatase activity
VDYVLEEADSADGSWSPFLGTTGLIGGQNVVLLEDEIATKRLRLRTATGFGRIPNPDRERFVWIEPGTFLMGSPEHEQDRWEHEGPQTEVTLTRGFWMGKYEVTQGEYAAVMGDNPSRFNGGAYGIDLTRPVEMVTRIEALSYCLALTDQHREEGRIVDNLAYRLPTEAECEYVWRAGTTTRFSFGDDPDYSELPDYAWYAGNSGGQTHPVGQLLPNPWGLYDLEGNVSEWCSDWYANRYPGGTVIDPQGSSEVTVPVHHGGSWDHPASDCRSAYRDNLQAASGRHPAIGFRLVLAPTDR